VTGGSEAGVSRAAQLLDSGDVRDRYALAATGRGAIPLPVMASGG
jgi:hypothetical protein